MPAPDGSPPPHPSDPWSVVEVVDDIAAVSDEWDELADRVGAEPFSRPGWFAAWVRAFTPEGRLGVIVLRGRGGHVRAIVPLLRRGAQTMSPTNEHTPRFRILGEDDAAVAELAAILMRLNQRRLSLSVMGESDVAAIRAAAEAAGYRVADRVDLRSPFLPIAGAADAESLVGRKMRKELRRCRRRLEELGEVTVAVERGDGDVDAVLEEAFALEERQWKGEGGTAIVSSPQTHAFYLEIGRWAARQGTLRLIAMRLDGRMIAFELDLLDPSGMHSLKAGFDPEFARYSPGHLAALAAIEEALRAGVGTYELLGDAEPYKLRWTDLTRELRSLDASPGTLAGAVEHARVRYLGAARRRFVAGVGGLGSALRISGR